MKKIFTFVFCAFCAVNVWGTEVSVTIPESGTTTTADFPITLTRGSWPSAQKVYRSKTQQLYLASEIGSSNAGTIKSISFKSSNYATSSGDPDTRRKLTVYMQETELSSLSSPSSPPSFVDYSEASQIFSAKQFEITSGETFSFNNFEFNWSGEKNILITIIDSSKQNTTGQDGKTFVGYTPTATRGIAQTFDYNGDACAPYSTPTPLSTIAQITFTIDASESTTPSIVVDADALNFGSYYPEGETTIQTFTVKASNLAENITLSTAASGVTISPTSIEKTNTNLAGDGVEVTVTLDEDFVFNSTKNKISITSSGASDKEVTLSATRVVDGNFTVPLAINYVNSVGTYYNIGSATIKTIEDNIMTFNNASYSADFTAIATQGSYAATGKFTNLKGKLVAENLFKIFSYGSYSGPTKPTIVMEENSNNSTEILAIEDGTEMGSVTIERTFATNQWNTLCVPILLGSGDIETYFGSGTQVMAFNEANISPSSITLNFKSASQIEAGVPYLIKPTKDVANSIVLQNRNFYKTVTSIDHDGIRFEGVLVPTLIDGGDGSDYIIVGANNTLFHPTGEGTIKGMRAYFHVIGTTAKAALKTAKVSMNTGSTTELVLVKDNQVKPYKTMVNDQIVIVNEGKQINILGQIIK